MIKNIRLDVLRRGSYDPTCPSGPGRGKRTIKPEIGDVVMVCKPAKHNDAKYRILERFKSEQSLIIRYKGDSKGTIVPTRLVITLVAGCLLGGTADLAEGDQATYSAEREKN